MKNLLAVALLVLVSSNAHAHSNKHRSHGHYSSYKHGSKHKYKGHIHKKGCGHDKPEQLVCTDEERIVNGDFEDNAVTNSSGWQLFTSLSGWKISWASASNCSTSSSQALAELQSFPSEQLEGSSQFIELDSHCGASSCPRSTNVEIEQEIEAQVGEKLKLVFNYKPRMLNQGKMELTVEFGRNTEVLKNFTSTDWKLFTKEYTVKSSDLKNGKMNLSIRDTGYSNTLGMFVDNVSVKATNCTVTPKICTSAAQVMAYAPVGSINSNRKNSSQALSLPNGEPVNESSIKFTSLGFGGSIVLKLDAPVKNVAGPDLRVWESTAGNQTYAQYKEEADVFASENGLTWNYLGRVKNDNSDASLGEVDLGSMSQALYIKLVDRSPVAAGRDGFDVDAITCVNQENDFVGQIYYIDNTTKKIYKGAIEGDNVITKEVMDSPFEKAHIGQDQKDLVVIEASGQKRIKEINIETEEEVDNGFFDFVGSLTQVSVTNGVAVVNKSGTSEMYSQELGSGLTEYMGKVYVGDTQTELVLQGGDVTHNISGIMYVVTQADGGRLYRIDDDCCTWGIMHAVLVAKDLGKVSGLVDLSSGEMLVSIIDSTIMKLVNVESGAVKDLQLKGDLKKQGQGGDLAAADDDL